MWRYHFIQMIIPCISRQKCNWISYSKKPTEKSKFITCITEGNSHELIISSYVVQWEVTGCFIYTLESAMHHTPILWKEHAPCVIFEHSCYGCALIVSCIHKLDSYCHCSIRVLYLIIPTVITDTRFSFTKEFEQHTFLMEGKH